jgi:hypothetical protein
MKRMAVLALAALAACHAESAVSPKETPMPVKTAAPPAARPPIDLEAPARVETATFALG